MSRQPSTETQLRTARREIAELRRDLSRERIESAEYADRARKAEADAAEWRRRFDQLFQRDMKMSGKDTP